MRPAADGKRAGGTRPAEPPARMARAAGAARKSSGGTRHFIHPILKGDIDMSEKKEARFIVRKVPTTLLNDNAQILVDTETGVNYLVVSAGFGGGVTPLLDSSGKVVVDK